MVLWLIRIVDDVLTGRKEWLWLKHKLSPATENKSCAVGVYLGVARLVWLDPTVTKNRGEREYTCRDIINIKGICPR